MTIQGATSAPTDRHDTLPFDSGQARDAISWGLALAAALALTGLVLLDSRSGMASALAGVRFDLQPGSLLAPLVAAGVLVAVRRGAHERLGWGATLGLGYLAGLAWTLSLAVVDGGSGLASTTSQPQDYLRAVSAVGGDPGLFLRSFLDRTGEWSSPARQHPPGPVLLLWATQPLGLVRPATLVLAIALIGCLTVPLTAAAVRSLCGEPAARRLLPVLALAPWALWTTGSVDAVTGAVCAVMLWCGVRGSEPGRSPWWALLAGLLLGVAGLMSYSAVWLGATLLATYFVRRRPLLNIVSGAGALTVLGLTRLAGFDWAAGLRAARTDVGLPEMRPWLWLPLAVLVLLIAGGPALVAAVRKVRNTPGWPFLIGAALTVLFAMTSRSGPGDLEHAALPLPWLLVAAVAPDTPGGRIPPAPTLLIGIGAAGAVLLQAPPVIWW